MQIFIKNTSNIKNFVVEYIIDASVAQLDRVAGFEPVGWGFESLRMHQMKLSLTQSVLGGTEFFIYIFPFL